MHDLWLVARHEYLQRAGKRSFLLGAFSLPFLMIVVIGVTVMVTNGGHRAATIGYVDGAGILGEAQLPAATADESRLNVRSFSDGDAARLALEQREIQAFYVLPPDYLDTHEVELYHWDKAPDASLQTGFGQFIRSGLVSGLPAAEQVRLIEGPQVTLRSLDGARAFSSGEALNLVVPFVVALVFMITVMTSASYMLQVVADEKENRTVEVLITSVSPEQLIGGKALGLMGVTLTQLGIWLLAIMLALAVGARFVEPMRGLGMPWGSLLVIAIFFVPAYALVAGLMTAIGSAVAEVRQGQQIAGLLNLMFMLPLFLSALLFTDPNSPLMVALTLFPTTAFVTVSLRWGMSAIPAWQMMISWLSVLGSALLSIWAAARIFRYGMLRYGQRLSLSEALTPLARRVR